MFVPALTCPTIPTTFQLIQMLSIGLISQKKVLYGRNTSKHSAGSDLKSLLCINKTIRGFITI